MITANKINKNVIFNEIKVINIVHGEKVCFLLTGKIKGEFASVTVDVPYYDEPETWHSFLFYNECKLNDLVCEAVESNYDIKLNGKKVIVPTMLRLSFNKKLEIGSSYVINDDIISKHNEDMRKVIKNVNFHLPEFKHKPKLVNGIMFYNVIER